MPPLQGLSHAAGDGWDLPLFKDEAQVPERGRPKVTAWLMTERCQPHEAFTPSRACPVHRGPHTLWGP